MFPVLGIASICNIGYLRGGKMKCFQTFKYQAVQFSAQALFDLLQIMIILTCGFDGFVKGIEN